MTKVFDYCYHDKATTQCLNDRPIKELCVFGIHGLFATAVQVGGSGCSSVGRAVASNTRGPLFETSHWQNLYSTFIYLFTINCIEKTKINKKRPGIAHL